MRFFYKTTSPNKVYTPLTSDYFPCNITGHYCIYYCLPPFIKDQRRVILFSIARYRCFLSVGKVLKLK